MSVVRLLSVLPSWMLALLLGLGPLGAEVLAALGHAQVCSCCRSDEPATCCGEEAEAPATTQIATAGGGCPCAVVAPSSATPRSSVPRTSAGRKCPRGELERFHRAAELECVELALDAAGGSALAPRGSGKVSRAGPPGSSEPRGPGRASALGVLRL
jgi:hypothetical protein